MRSADGSERENGQIAEMPDLVDLLRAWGTRGAVRSRTVLVPSATCMAVIAPVASRVI
jgi:hypothetical protein